MNRPGLLLVGTKLYAGFGSHCDGNPYQGWIFGYDTTNLAAAPNIYCTCPNFDRGAVWQSGKGLVADAAGNIYFATAMAATTAATTPIPRSTPAP